MIHFLSSTTSRICQGLSPRTAGHKIDDTLLTSKIQEGPGRAHETAKRMLDILMAGILLPLALPLLLVAAVAIKISSSGPVFFLQERVGRHGRLFTIVKLRSMIIDAEKHLHCLTHRNEADGPIFKIKNDPRTTVVGGFLRRYRR